MKRKIFFSVLAVATAFSLQSCLDYDVPGDELNSDQSQLSNDFQGDIDQIDYHHQTSQEGFFCLHTVARGPFPRLVYLRA